MSPLSKEQRKAPEKYYEIKKVCFDAFGKVATQTLKDAEDKLDFQRGLVPIDFREKLEGAIDQLLLEREREWEPEKN